MSTKSNDTSRPTSPSISNHQAENLGLSSQQVSDDHGTSQKPVERAPAGNVAESNEARVSESQDVTVTEGAETPARPPVPPPVTVQVVPTIIVCPKERTPRPSSMAREPSQLEDSSSPVRPRKSVVIMDYPQQQPYPQQYYAQQPMMVQGQPMMVQGQPMMVQGQPMMVQGQPMMMQQQPMMMQQQPMMMQQQPPPQQEPRRSSGCAGTCCKLCCSCCLAMTCLAQCCPCISQMAGEHAEGCCDGDEGGDGGDGGGDDD